jgi:hypothetical protein
MDKFNFDVILKRMERMKSDLPVRLANQAQNFFVASFDKQGWDNGSVTPWAPRKGKVTNKPILVKTGALRRAVSASIRNTSFQSVKLVVALPYAKYLNEGTDRMPKRQFVGDSATLRLQQKTKIISEINKAWHP